MKNLIFGALYFFLLTVEFSTVAQETGTKFQLSDFEQLHQMEGDWKGMAGNSPFFEGYKIMNDTLMEIRYFSDAALTKTTGTGSVYFSNGNIYHRNGISEWKLTKKEDHTFFFEPAKKASNTFRWILKDDGTWTAEVGSPGRSRVYEMKKIKSN